MYCLQVGLSNSSRNQCRQQGRQVISNSNNNNRQQPIRRVEDLGDGHLQAQLQDLSKNDGGAPVVGDFDGKENMIPGSNNNRMEEQGDGQKEEEDDEDEMDEYDRRDEADNMEV
nr:hypothetical protein BaRGS_028210 [Batillaria attramentaria]